MPRMDSVPPSDRTLDPDNAWSCVEIPPGTHLDAVLIGKPFGVWCHCLGSTRPCRARMTKGELPCPLDKDGKGCKPRLYAYCPMRTSERERVVVRVTSRVYTILAQPCMVGGKVRIERTRGPRGRLRVVDMPSEQIAALGWWGGRVDVDIHDYLLRLWADYKLIRWAKGTLENAQPVLPMTTPVATGNDNALSLAKAKGKLSEYLQREREREGESGCEVAQPRGGKKARGNR